MIASIGSGGSSSGCAAGCAAASWTPGPSGGATAGSGCANCTGGGCAGCTAGSWTPGPGGGASAGFGCSGGAGVGGVERMANIAAEHTALANILCTLAGLAEEDGKSELLKSLRKRMEASRQAATMNTNHNNNADINNPCQPSTATTTATAATAATPNRQPHGN